MKLFVLECLFLNGLGGAKLVSSMYNGHLACELGKVHGLLNGSVASADHIHLEILEEGGVAGGAEGNALAYELLFVLAAYGAGMCAGGDDDGPGLIFALGAHQLLGLAGEVHGLYGVAHSLAAELLGLLGHPRDEAGTGFALKLLAGVVLDLVGDGDLAAVLTLLYYKGGQSAASGVQAGGKSCRARSQYYYVVYFAHNKYSPCLIVAFMQSSAP